MIADHHPVKVVYIQQTERVPGKYVGFLKAGHCLLVRDGRKPVTLYCLEVQVDEYVSA